MAVFTVLTLTTNIKNPLSAVKYKVYCISFFLPRRSVFKALSCVSISEQAK